VGNNCRQLSIDRLLWEKFSWCHFYFFLYPFQNSSITIDVQILASYSKSVIIESI